MARRKKVEPKYEVELVLGQRKTGMMLPKNTGNWFAFRVFVDEKEIGMVEVGRGSIFWKPYRNRRYGTAFRRSWEEFRTRMEMPLK